MTTEPTPFDDLSYGFDSNPKLEFLYFRTVDLPLELPDSLFNGRHAYLLQDVKYVDSHGDTYTAHAGLITDGGSIPRFFWRVAGSPFTYYLLAYLIHDDLRKAADKLTDAEARHRARKKADLLFGEMLYWIDRFCRYIDVPAWKRYSMYCAVRMHAKTLNGASHD